MTVLDLVEAGFEKQDDPQFPFKYKTDLFLDEEGNDLVAEEDQPALVYDQAQNRFALWSGDSTFIYTNHKSPQDAIAWLKHISHFEPTGL